MVKEKIVDGKGVEIILYDAESSEIIGKVSKHAISLENGEARLR